jgi:biotin carboxyl carrier protein
MSSEYKIHYDDKDFDVEIKRLDEGGLLYIRVGDESYTVKANACEDGTWTVNDTITDHSLRLIEKAGKEVSIEIDGDPRDILWERVRKVQTVSTPNASTRSGGPKKAGGIYPPMPGKITEVSISVGDSVESGQTVCILEAMKMFNELKSPSDGIVKQVNVEPGSAVTPDDLLILIE